MGFKILYQREEEGFAMIERQGARIMLDEIRYTEVKRIWLSAPIEVPFGRGINLEIKTIEIDELYNHCKRSESNIFLPIEDKWYRTGDAEVGQRQFIVLDPDGYMLRFAQVLSE